MTPLQLLQHADDGHLWPDDADPAGMTSWADAYRTALAVRALRIARGERPAGYKIGFTNRGIWQRYQVFAPIWGPVWAHTVQHCDGAGRIGLARLCQPRIEPEVVFGIASTPPPDASLEDLAASLAWAAPGFEIVQSHRPDWKFTAAETIADGALHARLLIGTPVPLAGLGQGAQSLDQGLAASGLALELDGQVVERGQGALVLGSPLRALHHFLGELRRCPGAPDLNPGDVVTTGTWTDAWPVRAGQGWRATFSGPAAALGSISVRFDP